MSYGIDHRSKMRLKIFYHVTSKKSSTGVKLESEFIIHTKTEAEVGVGVKLFGTGSESESKKLDFDHLWSPVGQLGLRLLLAILPSKGYFLDLVP